MKEPASPEPTSSESRRETVADLTQLTHGELIARWREVARTTPATPADYDRELTRRNVARVNNLLLAFTVVVTIATIAALVIAIVRS